MTGPMNDSPTFFVKPRPDPNPPVPASATLPVNEALELNKRKTVALESIAASLYDIAKVLDK